MSLTVWTPIRSGQNVGPDLGQNCLKWLSADDNVMKKFNALLKYISLGSNCLKGLSADDIVMSKLKT